MLFCEFFGFEGGCWWNEWILLCLFVVDDFGGDKWVGFFRCGFVLDCVGVLIGLFVFDGVVVVDGSFGKVCVWRFIVFRDGFWFRRCLGMGGGVV